MANQQLLDYIESQINEGVNKEEIKSALLQNGWADADINEAFLVAVPPAPEPVPPSVEISSAQKSSPLATSTLETSISPDKASVVSAVSSPVSSPIDTADKYGRSVMHEKEKHGGMSSLTLALLLSVFAVLLVGGGVLAYFSFSKLSPDEVFVRMYDALDGVSSSKYSSEFSVKLQASSDDQGDGELQASIILNGALDIFDPDNVKAEGDITINVDASSDISPVGLNFDLDVDVRVLDGIVYARMNKITGIPIPTSGIMGKWLRFDSAELDKYSAEQGIYSGEEPVVDMVEEVSILPVTSYGAGQVANISAAVQKSLKENKELRDKVFAQVDEFSLEFKEIMARSTINGEDKKIGDTRVYHYIITLSKEDWRTVIEKLAEIGITTAQETSNDSTLSIQEFEEFKSSNEFDKLLGALAMIKTEIWIGKKDFLPYKTTVSLEFDDFKFDDPFGVANTKAKQAAIMANLSSIIPSAEIFYDSNNSRYGTAMTLGSCPEKDSDSTMFAQDISIRGTIDSIRSIGAEDVYCVADGAQKYAISATFKDSSGSWCVDNSGFLGSGVAGNNAQCGEYVQTTEAVSSNSMTLNGILMLTSSVSDYNQPVVVEAPKNSISFTDVVKGFMSGMFEI